MSGSYFHNYHYAQSSEGFLWGHFIENRVKMILDPEFDSYITISALSLIESKFYYFNMDETVTLNFGISDQFGNILKFIHNFRISNSRETEHFICLGWEFYRNYIRAVIDDEMIEFRLRNGQITYVPIEDY